MSNNNQSMNAYLLSEDVEEILATPPSWTMIWGTAMIVLVIGLLAVVGYFFKYPKTVSSKIQLTTLNPPVPVVADEDLLIDRFLVEEGVEVNRGALLAIRENAASFEDVLTLERIVKELRLEGDALVEFEPLKGLQLGTVSDDYYTFINALEQFSFVEKDKFDIRQRQELRTRRVNIGNTRKSLQEKLKVANRELKVAENTIIVRQGEYSDADSSQYNYYRNELQNAIRERDAKMLEISEIESEISKTYDSQSSITQNEYRLLYETGSRQKTSLSNLEEKLGKLASSIITWREENLIHSPIDGKVAFFGEPPLHQVIPQGAEVLNIIPNDKQEIYIAEMNLPVLKTVEVKQGQYVRLKFDRYPFRKWGFVWGRIAEMKINQQTESYRINIELTDGLQTNKGKSIPFTYNMSGVGDIITADRRFIARIFDEIKGE